MELALPVDPRSLIERYEVYRDAAREWLRDPLPTSDSDVRLAELVVVTADRLLWEPYACAFGLSSVIGDDPAAIVSDFPYDMVLAGEIGPDRVRFLAYSQEFRTIPQADFVGGAYVLSRLSGSGFANAGPDINCMESCAIDHPEDVAGCIRRRCLR